MASRRGRTQAYSAGNKVYGSGRSMPTIGPVDKTGYRERDAKHMIWKNAISRRLGAGSTGPGGGIADAVPNGAAPVRTVAPLPQIHNNAPGEGDRMGGVLNTRTPTGQPSTGQPQAPQTPGNPLTATPSGQMRPTNPGNGGTPPGLSGLPYDPAYMDMRRAIENRRNQFKAGLDEKKGRLKLQAGEQRREVDQAAPNILRHLLDSFAGRGMAHSGRYATSYGEQQNEFADRRADIDRSLAEQLAAMASEESNFDADLNSQLSQAEYDYIRSIADRAGDLGLDAPVVTPEAPQAPQVPEPAFQFPVPQPMMPGTTTPDVRPSPGTGPVTNFNPIGRRPVENSPKVAGGVPAYQPPVPPPPAPSPTRSHDREIASFDARSRAILTQGGTVVGGNGLRYKYDPITQKAVALSAS